MKVNPLKTSWLNHQIPNVTKGFYGDNLTSENINVKTIIKDCDVLVGDKTSGHLSDKEVVNYFLQFVGYPEYRRYIIDTLHKLDRIKTIN